MRFKVLPAQPAGTPVYNRYQLLAETINNNQTDDQQTTSQFNFRAPNKTNRKRSFKKSKHRNSPEKSMSCNMTIVKIDPTIESTTKPMIKSIKSTKKHSTIDYTKESIIDSTEESTIDPTNESTIDSTRESTIDSTSYAKINHIITDEKCGPKPTINVQILGINQLALIDSGSQVNAVYKGHLPTEVLQNLTPASHTITSFTGNQVSIAGTFVTDVQIKSIKLKKCYFYVTNEPRSTIIGTPAIKFSNIKIDIPNSCIEQNVNGGIRRETFDKDSQNNSQIDTLSLKVKPVPPLQMEVTSPVTIPRRSTKWLSLSSRYPIKCQQYYASTDAFDHNLEQGILVGKSVSVLGPEKDTCIIRLCNINDHDVVIRPNQRIINLHTVEVLESTIDSINDSTLDSTIDSTKESNLDSTSNSINAVNAVIDSNIDSTKIESTKRVSNPEIKLQKVLGDIKIGTKNRESIDKIHNIIRQNLDAFATDDEPLGCTDKAIYDIDTGNTPPTAQQRYRTPYYLRDEMQRIIQKNVNNGLMEPCSSPYAAPVLLVRKPNGSWRLVCDYRKLNTVTVSDCYPLPGIEDLVTSLSKSRVFSSADLWTGFHQIPCSDRAKEKLAITTDFGQFTWLHMPMGGKNAPSVFQRLMDRIFQSIPRSELVIYLDDMLCHSETEEENIKQLDRVLRILKSNNLKIRAAKTELLMSEIKFCGYIIGNGIRKPNPEKVASVKKLKSPTNKMEAQSIFGLLNYHRHFINNFSGKAAPITASYRGTFKWTQEAEHALDKLKFEIGSKALKLRIPDVKDTTFVMETDASNHGYGACLFICIQNNNKHVHSAKCLRPMEYASRQFTPTQRNYSTMEKELWAGREALRKWSHFLLGRPFTWRTDNSCVQWAHRVRSQKQKISQWLSEMSEYDITIERRPTSAMKISDCLSRMCPEISALHISKQSLCDLQENDEILRDVRQYVQRNRWPNNPPFKIKPYLVERSNLVFGSNGELLFNNGQNVRTIPPACIRSDVLKAFHDKNGHPGEKQTIGQLQNNYFWPNLPTDVKDYIRSCHQCQITKPNLRPKQPHLGKSETPSRPWEMISWDLIGPLPITKNYNKYVLTGFDLFSKRTYGINLQTKESDVIEAAVRNTLLQHPIMPKTILTDNGTEFSKINSLCHQYNMIHKMSVPYHPQANGGVERANQTLKNRLFSNGERDTWDERLSESLHSMNCSTHAVTKLTPFAVETGYPGQNTHDILTHEQPTRQNVRQYNEVVKSRILDEKQKRVEKFQNEAFEPFKIGDLVLARNMAKDQKFPRFFGPYKIIEVRGSGLSYIIKSGHNGQTFTRYVSQLKPYAPRVLPTRPENNIFQPQQRSMGNVEDEDEQPEPSNSQNNQTPQPAGNRSPQRDNQHNTRTSKRRRPLPFSCGKWDMFYLPPQKQMANPEPARLDDTLFFDSLEPDSDESIVENLPRDSTIDSTIENVQDGLSVQNSTIESNAESIIESTENTSIQMNASEELDIESTEESMTSSSNESHSSLSEILLSECDKVQLTTIAKKNNIKVNGTVQHYRHAINKHFRKHFPDHKRNQNGMLLFPRHFDLDNDRNLYELSKTLLKALIHEYKLPKPKLYSLATKEDLRKHIDHHTRLMYPNHVEDQTGVLLFKPKIYTNNTTETVPT